MRLSVLIAVTHLLGLGHLIRAAALARGFAARGHDVTLVSGGRAAPLVRTDAVHLVQLEPVHIQGTAFSALLGEDGQPLSNTARSKRERALIDVANGTQPDVVITELFPFGRRVLREEFGALLTAIATLPRAPLVLASVRDILAPPSKQERLDEAHEWLRRFYDGVLVHADPAVVPIEASWPLSADLMPLIHYTGYIDDASMPPPIDDAALPEGEILISGGGSAASRPLYEAALAAAALRPDSDWRLLIGHAMPADVYEQWRRVAPHNVVLERARPDFRNLLRRCAVSVSQYGYNTALDLLATGARAVVVPFSDGGETEQRARAALFADRGLVTALDADHLSAATLLAAIDRALVVPQSLAADIQLDGAATSVELVERLVVSPAAPRLVPSGQAMLPLRQALDRYADAQEHPLLIWWRDDDAIVVTKALMRLLALSEAHGAPFAIASIPGRAQSELAAVLDQAPLVDVLVHGLTHANHAPSGEKKAEFGAHRPRTQLRDDAREALALARARFGDQLLPVFVPPWNRISPELVKELPTLGYAGLSTANDRPQGAVLDGLAQINTHVDPIDWHGSRSLANPQSIVGGLVAAIERRSTGLGPPEPIGLLTHHLVHDEAIWSFAEAVLGTVTAHPGVRLARARDLFALPTGT